jgi:hypothetical protein
MSADAPTRNEVVEAVYSLLVSAWPWQTASRRERLWSDVPPDNRPAMFLFEGGPQAEKHERPNERLGRRRLQLMLLVYTNANKDSDRSGMAEVNDILDAVEAALKPQAADTGGNLQTLGGRVTHCHIFGDIDKVSGNLTGDGMATVPIEILLP